MPKIARVTRSITNGTYEGNLPYRSVTTPQQLQTPGLFSVTPVPIPFGDRVAIKNRVEIDAVFIVEHFMSAGRRGYTMMYTTAVTLFITHNILSDIHPWGSPFYSQESGSTRSKTTK